MGVLTAELREVASTLSRRAAPEQAGIFSGDNPAVYNLNDPIRLWVIQVVVIIGFTQILALILGRIRQPRVIAEVIGGVILGPSIMGRIPNFSSTIFPTVSLPLLNLTSTIGLVLFLFLVALELDIRIIKRNAKASLIISAAGLVLPLGLGAALGVPIYHQFINPDVNFGYFVLFTAVAVGITAFPVLCRILTELKLLDTTVGAVTLAAGVGNDVVGWILLALTVALVNAGSGLTALWVLLTAIGFVIFLLFPVRWAFRWLARRTGSLENGQPTPLMMTVTIVLVFISAFFTDIIGVHAIFGGFLAGLIIPHDNGFAIALVEKFEDLLSILFLPLYFTLSGLRTNLGLLDNGITWGYVFLICTIAFFSKFIGCSVTAYFFGFNWRESGAIGSLMSCKGLVELIVLNVGLQAGILDTRTFSMFVLHALILTFMTTPLTLLFYPAHLRSHAGTVVAVPPRPGIEEGSGRPSTSQESFITRVSVVVDKIEQVPAVMTLTQLLQYSINHVSTYAASVSHSDEKSAHFAPTLTYNNRDANSPVSIDVLRLIELTERASAVLMSQSADSLIHSDPVLSVIRTFGYLNRMIVSTALSVISWEEFVPSVATHVKETNAQMVIVPWSTRVISETLSTETNLVDSAPPRTSPFDALFGQKQSGSNEAIVHSQFIRRVFTDIPADVALFVDRGLPQASEGQLGQHIFLPFFGGPDDRLALQFVVQLCMSSSMSATVVRYTKVDSDDLSPVNTIDDAKAQHILSTSVLNTNFGDTVLGVQSTQMRMQSDTADNLLWDRCTNGKTAELAEALTRIVFDNEKSSRPLHAILDTAARTISERTQQGLRVLVVTGRSRTMAVESHAKELRQLIVDRSVSMSSDAPKTLGPIGAAFIATNANTSLLVLQARHR